MFNQYHTIMTEITAPINNLKFEEVYKEYKPLIEYFLRNKIKSEETREDIVAMTFVKVAKHLHVYNPEHLKKAKLSTWIHMIANRLVIDEYRKTSITIDKTDLCNIEGEEAFEFVGELTANAGVENKELHRTIRKAMRNLKPVEKHIAILRFVKEFDYTEIAEKLDLPLNTVKVMLLRAKEKLQESLKYEYASL